MLGFRVCKIFLEIFGELIDCRPAGIFYYLGYPGITAYSIIISERMLKIDKSKIWARTGKSVSIAVGLIIIGIIFRQGMPLLGEWWRLIRIVMVFGLVATLIRKQWDVGVSLLAASLAMGLMFPIDLSTLRDGMTFGLFNPERAELRRLAPQAVELLAIVYMINVLGGMLGARDSLKKLIFSLEHLVRDVRYVGAIIPAAIGLLPTPGGAMLTAPLVGEVGKRIDMDPVSKTACNYWFRHVWEFWWPLFPGVIYILNDKELGISAGEFILSLLPLSFIAILGGWLFILRPINRPQKTEIETSSKINELKNVVLVLWPVAGVVFGLLLAPENMESFVFILALIIVCVILAIQKRLPLKDALNYISKAGTLKMALLIFAVYLLRSMFLATEAADGLPEFMTASRVPVPIVCFFVPWIVGLLTGYTLAGIVTTFPLLMGIVAPSPDTLRVDLLMLAYTGSFTGVLMSPSHLCLILTRDYFSADFSHVYRRIIPPYALVLVGVAALWAVLAWIN